MRRLVRLSARLYPHRWWRRYGQEFDALLEETKPGWRDVFDVLGGAIGMQISTWSFRNVTAACGILGLILAAGWAFSLPNLYVSRALMHVESPAPGLPALSDRIVRIWQGVVSRQSLNEIIQRPGLELYKDERRSKPLEDVIEGMKQDITIELLGDHPRVSGPTGAAFTVAFRYPDPVVAQKVTRVLVTKVIDANQIAARRENNSHSGTRVDLLDPARLPQKPIAPNRWQIVLLGLVLGLVGGVLIVGARRWRVVAASGIAGLIIGYAAYWATPKTWVSHAVFYTDAPRQLPALAQRVTSDEALKKIIERQSLYPRALRSESMAEVIRDMRSRDVRIDAIEPHGMVISYRYVDPLKARLVVDDLVDAVFRINVEDSSVVPKSTLDLLDPASMPEKPAAPSRPVVCGGGMGLGILGGLIAKWFGRRRR